jgi:3-isopropylmalate/(R)-2-methylmalate dehydratase small subunit
MAREPFTRLTAVAAPLDLPDVDTDRIIPARFLRHRPGPGWERYLFHDERFAPDGSERPDFVLNRAPYRGARILVTAPNFGCGSSREAAVWALAAWGIRAVLGPSFGDIFFQNCAKNGLLAVVVPAEAAAGLRLQLHDRPGAEMTVDLEAQAFIEPGGTRREFAVDPFVRECLLTGQDEIALTLSHEAAIAAFEARHRREEPWLWPG